MKFPYELIKRTALFKDIEGHSIESMMGCLGAQLADFAKGSYIYYVGDCTQKVGVVLSGRIHIIKEDLWGNRNIITEYSTGEVFGEAYAALASVPLEVSAYVAESCLVLFMDVKRIITTCPSACMFHTQLIRNLLAVVAQKNLVLTRKVEHVSKRTTREKLLSYLVMRSKVLKSSSFEIPFNRQQLADYLAVDRSAMSNELCKLRDDGILTFDKNRFEFLRYPEQ